MATAGKITLAVSGGNSIDVNIPVFGYRVSLVYPFDFAEMDDKSLPSFDHGSAYDKRYCECSLWLDETEAAAFDTFLNSDLSANGRAKNVTLSMSSNSGFFPFGPDKGTPGRLLSPYSFRIPGQSGTRRISTRNMMFG